MNEKLDSVLRKLNKSPVCRRKFNEVFSVREVSTQVLLRSMAEFLVSYENKYNFYRKGEDTLSKLEL